MKRKSSKAAASSQKQLDSFLARFTPELATLGRRALVKMRKRLPNAIELVYDNYNALVIGFGSSERPSDRFFDRALSSPGRSGFSAGSQAPRPAQMITRKRHGGPARDAG